MFAIKANRQYKIEPEEKQKYIDQGYKIATLERGKLIFEEKVTPESKEIAKLKAENKKLQEALAKLEAEKQETKGEGK